MVDVKDEAGTLLWDVDHPLTAAGGADWRNDFEGLDERLKMRRDQPAGREIASRRGESRRATPREQGPKQQHRAAQLSDQCRIGSIRHDLRAADAQRRRADPGETELAEHLIAVHARHLNIRKYIIRTDTILPSAISASSPFATA